MPLPAWFAPAAFSAAVDVGQMLFSKHQADTAHQREVKDFIKAGINPYMTAGSHGAGMPYMPNISSNAGHAVSTAQQERRQAEERAEIRARTRDREMDATRKEALLPSEVTLTRARAAVEMKNVEKLELMLPYVVRQVEAELEMHLSSAASSRAMTDLHKLARAGALNEETFQKQIGVAGPWGRVLLGAGKAIGAGGLAAMMLKKPSMVKSKAFKGYYYKP